MRYIEGMDYWVRPVEFPNMASPSVAVSNGDGTFTIYINTRFPPELRTAGLRHELEHLEGEHFYRDDVELAELEAAADRLVRLTPRRSTGTARGRRIPYYRNAGEFLEHFLRSASPESLGLLRQAGLLPESGSGAAR